MARGDGLSGLRRQDLQEVWDERDEARAEADRLRAQVEADQKRAAAMMRDIGAKWAEAFDGVKAERDEARAEVERLREEKRELYRQLGKQEENEQCRRRLWQAGMDDAAAVIARLRAALSVFADGHNWYEGAPRVEWDGPGDDPWTIAREALSPPATAPGAALEAPESALVKPEATVEA